MELGVVIKHTDAGEREAYGLNKSDALVKGSNDMRYLFRFFATPPNGKDLILLRFLGSEGVLVAVMRLAIETTRGDENSTAWIHVPDKLDITGKDLAELIEQVKKQMTAKTPNFDSIDNYIKSKNFKPRDIFKTKLSEIRSLDNNNNYAYRLYGQGENYKLYELLDPKRLAQKEYSDYSGIILLDIEDSLSFKPEQKIKELRTPLNKTLVLEDPGTILGFEPYYNRLKFEKYIEVYEGDEIQLQWKKAGLKDVIKKHLVVPSDDENPKWYNDAIPDKRDIKYTIGKANFTVNDESGSPITTFNLTIDNNSIKDAIYFSEDVLKKEKKIRIDAEGYKPYEGNITLNNIPTIKLEREAIIEFSVELINNTKGRLIIDAKNGFHYRNTESPLKGYELKGNNSLVFRKDLNTQFPDGKNRHKKWFEKQRFKVMMLLLVGVIFGGIIGYTLSYKILQNQQHTTINANLPQNSGTKESNQESESSKILDYINSNNIWVKKELEKDSLTAGLFNALLSLDLQKIKETNNSVSSNKLNEILSELTKLQTDDQRNNMLKRIQSKSWQTNDSIDLEEYVNLISQSLEQKNNVESTQSSAVTETPIVSSDKKVKDPSIGEKKNKKSIGRAQK